MYNDGEDALTEKSPLLGIFDTLDPPLRHLRCGCSDSETFDSTSTNALRESLLQSRDPSPDGFLQYLYGVLWTYVDHGVRARTLEMSDVASSVGEDLSSGASRIEACRRMDDLEEAKLLRENMKGLKALQEVWRD